MVPQYMDVTVGLTNLYNDCDLDYYMQAFSRPFTSVSGFLDILVNISFRFLYGDTTEEALYESLSTAVSTDDRQGAGLYFGQFMKLLMVIEIPTTTSFEYYQLERIETVRTD